MIPQSSPETPDTARAAQRRKRAEVAIHVIAEGTGALARHALEVALTQFPGLSAPRVFHVLQDQPAKLLETLAGIREERPLVVLAIASRQLRRLARDRCRRQKLACFDLTSPLVAFLSRQSGARPLDDASRVHQVNEEYLARIAALEFTLQHDDSRRIETAPEADIVLIGVSRVSKTPTSVYLGSLGYKVANVTIVPELGFPPQLEGARGKIAALTLDPEALHEIRARRFAAFKRRIRGAGLEDLAYYQPEKTLREVLAAEEEYRRRGYPILDISGLTVEEVAARVIKILRITRPFERTV